MDGSSFDRWTRELAAAGSRRWFGKRLAIASGAVIAGVAKLGASDAARRPAPTTVPVSCPGIQIWTVSGCACPVGSSKCGPDCCPDGQAECCGNACCYGACFGEELCCPSPNIVCDGVCRDWECCGDADCDGGICSLETHTCIICSPICDGTVWGENSCGQTCECGPGRTLLSNGTCGVPCVKSSDCLESTGCETCMYGEDGAFCTNGDMNHTTCGGFGGTCAPGYACTGTNCMRLC